MSLITTYRLVDDLITASCAVTGPVSACHCSVSHSAPVDEHSRIFSCTEIQKTTRPLVFYKQNLVCECLSSVQQRSPPTTRHSRFSAHTGSPHTQVLHTHRFSTHTGSPHTQVLRTHRLNLLKCMQEWD